MSMFFKALFGLFAFDLTIALGNFARLHRTVAGWKVATRAPSPQVLDKVCAAVNSACIWYPKRAMCLQRAAVTTCLLRKYGVAAVMVIGAQKLPFAAHAWVEVNGTVINEKKNVQAIYGVWERC